MEGSVERVLSSGRLQRISFVHLFATEHSCAAILQFSDYISRSNIT